MSDLAATNCGCGCDNDCGCGGNNRGGGFFGDNMDCSCILLFLVLLSSFCGNGRSGCSGGCNGFGNGMDCSCILLFLLLFCGGSGFNFC